MTQKSIVGTFLSRVRYSIVVTKIQILQPGMVSDTCNPSTSKAEAGGSPGVEASLRYIARSVFKNQKLNKFLKGMGAGLKSSWLTSCIYDGKSFRALNNNKHPALAHVLDVHHHCLVLSWNIT